jgi:hypothetical protein
MSHGHSYQKQRKPKPHNETLCQKISVRGIIFKQASQCSAASKNVNRNSNKQANLFEPKTNSHSIQNKPNSFFGQMIGLAIVNTQNNFQFFSSSRLGDRKLKWL